MSSEFNILTVPQKSELFDKGFSNISYSKEGYCTLSAGTSDQKTIILASDNPEIKSYGILNGLPINFERSRNIRADITFFGNLVNAMIDDGGVLIMIDHRDDYISTDDLKEDDGAHYALIKTTSYIRGEHRFKRNQYGVIPLPIFTRLMDRGWMWNKAEDEAESDITRWNLIDVVDFFNNMFPGRVCLADGTFHRVDSGMGNEGIVSLLGGYKKAHGLTWEDPLCQVGIDQKGTERFIEAYNDPSELIVVRGGEIVLVSAKTKTEEVLSKGELVGVLNNLNESQWMMGLKHEDAPARNLYGILG